MHTKRQAFGQLVFCVGCCCGRVERGLPAVPVERLKEVWKREKLNRSIQLTISGCLGPCDLPNVVLLLTPRGHEWLGGVVGADFELLIDWARACDAADRFLPLPAALDGHRLERRFLPEEHKVS